MACPAGTNGNTFSSFSTTKSIKTGRSFLILLIPAFLLGALLALLTPYKWLPAAAALLSFCTAVLMTGFSPLLKGRDLIGFVLSEK